MTAQPLMEAHSGADADLGRAHNSSGAPASPPPLSVRTMRAVSWGVIRGVSYVWLLVLVLAFWQWRTSTNPSLFVPPITDIWTAFVDNWLTSDVRQLFLSDTFWDNARPSLTRAGQGYLLATLIGVPMGVLIGVSRVAAAFFGPLVRFGMSIPSSAMLPVGLVLFGVTSSMNVFLIVFGSVWVILINTIDGVRSIDPTVVLTARSLRMGRLRYFTKVLLPGASPQIFTGLRVGIGITLILMVVSELFAATEGIGFYIVFAQRTFRFVDMWSAIMLLAIIGVVANGLFALIETRVLRWHHASRGAEGGR